MPFHLRFWTFILLSIFSQELTLGQNENEAWSRTKTAPNILFLFADDQRWDTIGAYGNSKIETPNLDQLARSGVNFRNAYCFGSPHGAVCIPSRAMLHSGQTYFNLPNLELARQPTLGELLQKSGYQTFATGKWHNGKESFLRSFELGRNVMFGGMSDHSKVPVTQLDSATRDISAAVTGEHFSSRLFADAAIEFLTNRDDSRPFFCYVAFTAPHDPRMSPGNFNRMYRPEEMLTPPNFLPQHPFDNGDLTVRDEELAPWPRTPEVIQSQLADYYGLISHLDQQVGRIVDALRESENANNTIIIYAADHGLAMGSHGLLGKQNLYEHSTKAPLIICGPDIENGTDESMVYLHELFPTILELAGCPINNENNGRSLAQVLNQNNSYQPRRFLTTSYKNSIRAIRDERWKLIQYPLINRTQLFDLKSDPNEVQNLADSNEPQHKEIIQRLWNQLIVEQNLVGDSLPLTSADPLPAEIDLTGRPRKPDQWQPKWIIEKYFDSQTNRKPAP